MGLLEAVPALDPTASQPLHLTPMVRLLERSWNEPVQATIHAPPRHGKTQTMLAFAAATLARNPRAQIGYVTYGLDLAREKSAIAKRYAISAGVQIEPGQNRADAWFTAQGGSFRAVGVGGSLTGKGLTHLLADDVFKDRLQAESTVYRRRVQDWFYSVGRSRVEPGGSEFISHTRWAPPDLIGYLHQVEGKKKDGGVWEDVCLPAIGDDGTALWPERWPLEELAKKRRDEYTWSSLYQGRPRPRGGALFEGVVTYSTLPATMRKCIGIDLAYSGKTSSDFSVAVVLGYESKKDIAGKECGTYFVLDMLRMQAQLPVFAARLAQLLATHPQANVHWFTGGQEAGIVDLLAKQPTPIRVRATPAKADKFNRALPTSADWNAGRVAVPENAPWVSEFLAEVCGFTGISDAHDDIVDSLAAAHYYLSRFSGDVSISFTPSR